MTRKFTPRITLLSTLLTFAACDAGVAPIPDQDGVGDDGSDGMNDPDDPGNPFGVAGWVSLKTKLPGEGIVYHTGFDSQNDYLVPLTFVGSGDIDFDFTVPGVASIVTTLNLDSSDSDEIPEGIIITGVVVRSVSAGETEIEATYQGTTYRATLLVNQYAPGDVTLGEERYNNPPDDDGGLRRACNSCHESLSKHSTAFLAGLNDEEILRTAVDGVGISVRDPNTGDGTSYEPLNGAHKWDVTDAERVGIAAFLRSRDPFYQLPGF